MRRYGLRDDQWERICDLLRGSRTMGASFATEAPHEDRLALKGLGRAPGKNRVDARWTGLLEVGLRTMTYPSQQPP